MQSTLSSGMHEKLRTFSDATLKVADEILQSKEHKLNSPEP